MTDPRSLSRSVGVAVALLTVCASLAACGSSSSSSGAAASAGSSSSSASSSGAGRSPAAGRASFRNCLKAHGVTLPNRPPNGQRPPNGGGFFGGSATGPNGAPARRAPFANNPKLRAAIQACGGSQFRGARRFQLSHQAINAFVACVRQHGFDMPSPNFSGKGQPIFPASIRTNPKFVNASKSCTSLLRPARPGAGTPAPGTTSAPSSS